MHTAPGPAGAARGHEKEFSRYLDSTARRSTSRRSRGGRRSPGAPPGGCGRGRRSGAPSAARSARRSIDFLPEEPEAVLQVADGLAEAVGGDLLMGPGIADRSVRARTVFIGLVLKADRLYASRRVLDLSGRLVQFREQLLSQTPILIAHGDSPLRNGFSV